MKLKDTIKDLFTDEMILGISSLVVMIAMAIVIVSTSRSTAKAEEPNQMFPSQPSVVSSCVDYTTIYYRGTNYIIFRDRLSGDIEVVPIR